MMNKNFIQKLPLYSELRGLADSLWQNSPVVFKNAQDNSKEKGKSLSIRYYESIGLCVYVRKVSDHEYSFYIPDGCFDRIFLLMFLFMSGDRVSPLKVLLSIRDRRDVSPKIPGKLRAVFSPIEEKYDDDVRFLIDKYCGNKIVPTFMRDAMVVSILFIMHHEFAHILNGHFEIKKIFLSEERPDYNFSDDTLGSSKRDIFEGFEVHADQEAARYIANFISGYIEYNNKNGEEISSFLINCAIGLAILVSLFDYRSRSIDAPGDSFYPHPLVRFTIITGAIREELPEEIGDAFHDVSQLAGAVVAQFINGMAMAEMENNEDREAFHPLSQLEKNITLLEDSVLFEYAIKSSERARRVVYYSHMMGVISSSDMADFAQAPPETRWKAFVKKMSMGRKPY